MSPTVRRLALCFCIGLLAVGFITGGAAAQEESIGEFVVDLETDGNATVEISTNYDLNNDDHREVFEQLQDDPTARDRAGDGLREAIEHETAAMNERVDREVEVGEMTVETDERGDTGVVTYRFTWENLAAIERGTEPAVGDRVVLSLPFSRYDDEEGTHYELDRELVVVAPDGHEFVSIAPEPGTHNETVATWPGLTSLEGFEVVAERTEEPEERDSGTFGAGSGFGVGVAVIGLVAAALLARRGR